MLMSPRTAILFNLFDGFMGHATVTARKGTVLAEPRRSRNVWLVITQIYTAQTPAEATALAGLGVDHVGVTVSARGLPGEVGMETGQAIARALRETGARCVALTVDTDLAAIEDFVAMLRPDIVHLCGDVDLVGPAQVAELREWIDSVGIDVEIMQAIPVSGTESIELAARFARHSDWLILDSVTDDVEGIGAAGVTHDWNLSKQIVEAVEVPVILAGGLGPDNVSEAIGRVRPAGVDSLTRTNRPGPDGAFTKDLDAVAAFVEQARLTN